MNKLLDNLDKLKKDKNLKTNRALSNLSGIPYTTIDGLYKRGTENVKLSTLQRLADFFEVSLDDLVGTNTDCNDVLQMYISKLNKQEKERLIKIIELTFPVIGE